MDNIGNFTTQSIYVQAEYPNYLMLKLKFAFTSMSLPLAD